MSYLVTILFTFLLLPAFGQGGDSGFVFIRSYRGAIADAALDNLDNLYIISPAGQVKKIGANGDSIAVYSQVRNSGQLFSIDVSNALKPLLFYKDFATVVILDRFLSQRAALDLKKLSILKPLAIGLSYDNNIWVFDEYDSKLKKIDEQGNLLFQSPDFRTVFSERLAPQKIISEGNLLYLADTATGVYVFDNYGAFKKKIPVRNWDYISLSGDVVVSTLGDEVYTYNPASFSATIRKLPASFQPYHRVLTTNNRLITLSAGDLKVYRFRF